MRKSKKIGICATCQQAMVMHTPLQMTHRKECKSIYDKMMNEEGNKRRRARRIFKGVRAPLI